LSKNRVVEIEVLRSLAFGSIIFQHILGGFLINSYPHFGVIYLQYLFLTLSRFGVPAFVLISGFASSYETNASSTVGKYFKRLRKILVPYIFWSVFFSFYNIYLNPKAFGSWNKFSVNTLFSLLKGDAMYHLWFMVLILQFCLLSPLIKRFINRFEKNKLNWAFLLPILILGQMGLMWIYINFLPSLYHEKGNSILNALILNRDKIFIFWIFYYILGIFAAKNYSNLVKLLHKYKIVILLGFISTFIYLALEGIKYSSHDVSGYSINSIITSPIYPKMIIFLLLAISLMFLLSSKITTKKPVLKKYLCIVADNSFRAYLIHPIFVRYFTITIKNLFYNQSSLLEIAVSFILTAAATIITAILLGKIKPLRIITG